MMLSLSLLQSGSFSYWRTKNAGVVATRVRRLACENHAAHHREAVPGRRHKRLRIDGMFCDAARIDRCL